MTGQNPSAWGTRSFILMCRGHGQHVPALLIGDGDRVLGERTGNFLQRQAVFADLDEVVEQPGPLAAQAVLQRDQHPV